MVEGDSRVLHELQALMLLCPVKSPLVAIEASRLTINWTQDGRPLAPIDGKIEVGEQTSNDLDAA